MRAIVATAKLWSARRHRSENLVRRLEYIPRSLQCPIRGSNAHSLGKVPAPISGTDVKLVPGQVNAIVLATREGR